MFGPGIDEPLALTSSSETAYFAVDGLGTTISLNGETATVQDKYTYDAWGVQRSITESVSQPFGYTSRERGDISGQWFYRARFYQSDAGRFVREDPIRFAADLHLFRYVGSAPLLWVDPEGLRIVNRSGRRIWYKDDEGDQPHPIDHGGVVDVPHDGIADPCRHPGKVFKTPADADVVVGPDDVALDGIGARLKMAAARLRGDSGGWKDKKWRDELRRKGDTGWDKLFDCTCPPTPTPTKVKKK